MFVDLVGSTAISARVDPEELCRIISEYQGAVADVVAETGGFIARYVGDGVLIYFGYPQAWEDDAERAVRCGLRISARVHSLANSAERLQLRVGIATGEVVVGDVVGSGASAQVIALGEAPNIGAKLQAEAEPGALLIDEVTRRLTGGLFEYEDKGAVVLKGLGRPVRAFAVRGERAGVSRFAALRPSRAGLVGRQQELALLRGAWEASRSGEGQVVLIAGEPGIGKSRLLAEFVARCAPDAPLLHFACGPNGIDSPLLPVRHELERAAQLRASDHGRTPRRKLDDLLAELRLEPAYAAAITRLLEGAGPENMSPRRMRESTFDAIDAYVAAAARGEPSLVVVEDIHWADPTTREWLERRVERADAARAMLVVTTRPETLPPWATNPLVTSVTLNRLHHRQAAELIRQVAQAAPVATETMFEIISRSDGLPLFIEELTQSVLERARFSHEPGDARDSMASVPTSLESLLASRLDRVGPARDVAQIASVIGREFSLWLLDAVSGRERAGLLRDLQALCDHALITARGQGAETSFVFRHVLIQEAAYRSLLRPRRRGLHAKIAAVLDGLEAIDPEQVALHYGRAGQHQRSSDWYRRAAARARGRYALAERVQHLRRAVAHTRASEDVYTRPKRELQILIELGMALIDSLGSGAEEVGITFGRARELCLQLGDNERLLVVLDALALNHHFARSDSGHMLRYAAELGQVADRSGSPLAGLWASRIRSSAQFLRGELGAAREELGRVIASYRELRAETERPGTARDPRASTYANLAICLTVQGSIAEGLAAADLSLRQAEQANSVPSMAASLRRACLQAMILRDESRVLALASRLMALTAEHETFTGLREGTIAQVWASLPGSFHPDALRPMLKSVDELEAAQHLVYLPFLMCAVADRALLLGDREGAAALLERSAALHQRTGEAWSEAELLRLRASLAEDAHAAAQLLRQSLTVARAQGACWWELRSAADLAAMHARAGQGEAATRLLEPLLVHFAGQADLPDIAHARALLDAPPARVASRQNARGVRCADLGC